MRPPAATSLDESRAGSRLNKIDPYEIQMPLKTKGLTNYGVLKGRAIRSRAGASGSPHYHILVFDGETHFRVSVNVKSRHEPSELLYSFVDGFQHAITEPLDRLQPGFTSVNKKPGGFALDYVRGNLFDRNAMTPLPYQAPGPDNDLNEKLDAMVQRAASDKRALLYAFGERWGPKKRKRDRYFRFLPGNGIHDVHMNQGSHPAFRRNDGVWQDGGLFLQFPATHQRAEHWVAVFLKFQSQTWRTDDISGYALADQSAT